MNTEQNMSDLYDQRLQRYYQAMRNQQPDRVPIRPFVAEMSAVYAGFTCQQVTHDYRYAFEAMLKMCRDFDWDATVPNMVYVWTGLTQTLGTRYYSTPGMDIPATTAFQYREPSEENAFMKADEYDRFIQNPMEFIANVWFPRTSRFAVAPGTVNTAANNIALVSGTAAMKDYFAAYGPHCAAMKTETGTPCAICGILKAPFDIIADKFRGYRALCTDMYTQPDKVLALTEALTPHLLYMAEATSDPSKTLPVALWLHRGCVPFLSPKQFDRFFWPSMKQVICALWEKGIQTLMYAEGEWNRNLKQIAQLPDNSIIYHVDRGDIFEVRRELGDRFCISGGIPNDLLALGEPDQVRDYTKNILQTVARDGAYILDASAIMQNDTKTENLRAMCEAGREFGAY